MSKTEKKRDTSLNYMSMLIEAGGVELTRLRHESSSSFG
jgi:hypothetical protein